MEVTWHAGIKSIAKALTVFVAIATVCAARLSEADAEPAASRVIDRTFSCQTGYLGGVYQVEAWAGKSVRAGSGSKRYGFASIRANLPEQSVGGIDADAIWVSRRNCQAVRTSMPLGTTGLQGGAIGLLERRLDCFTPRRVLIRIRGEFARPTSLRAVAPYGDALLLARGVVRKAQLAMSSPAGRRLAYASVDATQRTLLYTAPDCEED